MRRNTILCLITGVIFVFSTIGTTLAAWRVTDDSIHEINMSSVKGQIVEEYVQNQVVYPGGTVDKVVNVKNTGNLDSIIRVKVETVLRDGETVIETASNDIIIPINTDYWYYSDGYYYYKGVLAPNETTAKPLFESFTLSSSAGNEYAGREADIIVKMECLQAGGGAISMWGKTFSELGITYNGGSISGDDANVAFVNTSDGFEFDPQSTDLFIDFKNLVPGETRSQTINVENLHIQVVEIYLRADFIDQTKATPQTIELVNKLLHEYARITVTDELGKVIYEGPIWGNLDSASDTMRKDISLGKFDTGESRKLNVYLQVDPRMDNEYQELIGLIKWVWSAEGVEPTKPSGGGGGSSPVPKLEQDPTQEPSKPIPEHPIEPDLPIIETPVITPPDQLVLVEADRDDAPPKTGYDNHIYLLFSISALSGLTLIFLLIQRQREKEGLNNL